MLSTEDSIHVTIHTEGIINFPAIDNSLTLLVKIVLTTSILILISVK